MRSPVIKRFTLTAAAVLALTLGGQSFAASGFFSDLEGIPAKDKISALQQKGIVQGVSGSKFLPDGPVTAAQGIQLFVNALDLNIDLLRFVKEPKATDYFANANDAAWYAPALIIAANNDLGLPADLDPAENWTREEFTHQLMLAVEKHSNLPMIKIMPVEMADGSEFTAGYDGSIQRALVFGIASLDSGGKFHPAQEVTRAEAAEMVYNALEYIAAHPAPAEGYPQ
ncbi:S-layer homology domain-containing protein [Paenibacillus sp. PK3_47]|uniref:S-layer homology domain-containing protein n=1 Tax=Paenibacillus sp. PK3_47 TaxID=2072642 RepID=UPI00201DD325|nr:S-layer homology domain-containing protein [Paenibacillus sp. PK3_47]UQZ34042.1 S-layer homology domain-containing protein [Paenibacillus sp. PK3_47]